MCLTLPAFAVAMALIFGAPGPVLVLAALAGAAIGVAWARKSWAELLDEAVDLTIERDSATAELLDAHTDMAFRERLDQSLRASSNESATIELVLRAVAEVLPETEVSLLLNLPDEAKVGWSVQLRGGSAQAAVPVPDKPGCLAFSSLSTITAATSHAVDSCEHLRSDTDNTSSVCIPLRLGDRSLGAINALGAPGQLPSAAAIERAEWAVSRGAIRIAEQRLQRGPSSAGTPDPVTGLPGLPALRHQLKDLIRTLMPFCVSIVSIDQYEDIRLGQGEEAAEIALEFLADAMTSTLRPGDFICRIGGPDFGVVLKDCSARQATAVIERMRESLALLLALESQTAFTCSAGIVESHQATSLDELLDMAHDAMLKASAAGGNRVLLAFEADHM